MTTPNSDNYWTSEAEAKDSTAKKYRSIPVPAQVAKSQKHIDDSVKFDLLSEFLADKDRFVEQFPNLAHLSQEDKFAAWQDYIDKVRAAPPEKQADAQRSLGGHLEDFGTSIKNGLLKGVAGVLGAPGVGATMSALSVPGEEAAAQLIYNFARIIPGEQDIERGVNKWREENPEASWWKKATLHSAVREEGFGVPMGVHLPLEILFDPLNLVPFGAVFKLAKPTKAMIKLMAKGSSVTEAARYTARAGRIRRKTIEIQEQFVKDAAENEEKLLRQFEDFLDDVPRDPIGTPPGSRTFGARGLDTALGGTDVGPGMVGMGRAGRAGQLGRLRDRPRRTAGGHPDDDPLEAMGTPIVDPDAPVDVILNAGTIDPATRLGLGGERIGKAAAVGGTAADALPPSLTEQGTDFDVNGGIPSKLIRGVPMRDGPPGDALPQGLRAIINDKELDPDVRWAFQAWFHTGLRPNELSHLMWDDIVEMLGQAENRVPGERVSILVRGDDPSLAASRLLDEDAVDFFKQYSAVRDELGHTMKEAFRMPGGIPGDAVKNLNEAFVAAAQKEVHNPAGNRYGEELLDFYSGNGNFTYVFRLSKANAAYVDAGRGAKGLIEAMKILGHSSPIHTARYISLMHHNMGSIDDLLLEMGQVTSDDLVAATKELNEGAWRNKFTPEQLKKMGDLDIFKAHTKEQRTTKGYSLALHTQAIAELKHVRMGLINKFIDLDQPLQFELPEGLFSKATEGYRVSPEVPGEATSQYDILHKAIASLQSLQHFTSFLTNSISEKNLIKRSLEAAEKTSEPAIKALKDRAQVESAVLADWFEPILELAHSHMNIIDDIFKGADEAGDLAFVVANTKPLQHLKSPFDILGYAELAKLEGLKSAGGGGAKRSQKLSSLPVFQSLLNRALTPVTKKVRKGEKATAAQKEWASMTEEQREAAMELGTGFLVRPSADAVDRLGRKIKTGERAETWIILEFLRPPLRGAVAINKKTGLPNVAPITGMRLEKLGSSSADEAGLLVRSQKEKIVEVSLQPRKNVSAQFDEWSIIGDGLPWPPHMVRSVTTGGRHKLTAREVAHALFQWKGNPNMTQTKRSINEHTSAGGNTQTWSTDRLLRNELIVKAGKDSAGNEVYRFSDEVRELFDGPEFGGIRSEDWGYAKLKEEAAGGGKGGAKTPAPPESATPDPGIPPGMDPENKMGFFDEKHEWHDFVSRVTQPRGMMQKMTYRGGAMMYRFFKKLPPESHKLMRMLVPGTFGASAAARMRWAYVFSKAEGRNVASDIGHMLDELHSVTGSNRRNGIGTKIGFAQDVSAAVNPKTGRFVNNEILRRDYNRSHGVLASDVRLGDGGTLPPVVVDEDLLKILTRESTSEVQYTGQRVYHLGEVLPDLRMGPLAVMEQTFKHFKSKDSAKWTDKLINSERRRFNHARSLQDLSTMLGTHRDDLPLFYNFTPQQQRMYDWYHQVQPILLNVLEEAGYDITSEASVLGVARGKMRHSFVPHLTTEKFAGIDKPPSISELGQKPSQWMHRQHYWQISGKMEQGQAIGRVKHEIYNTDPILAIQRTAESYYDKIAADRFMDEFAKLGINNTELDHADDIGKRIVASRQPGGEALTDHYARSAHKFFGAGWRSLSDADVQTRINSITEMSVNWNNQPIKNAIEYAPIGTELRETALPPEASRELLALVQDEIHETTKFLTVPSQAANMLRIMATGADLGVALLHGFGGLGMMVSPVSGWSNRQRWAWGKAALNMGQAMLVPEVRREWYKSTQLTRADMQKYGIAFFRSTHIEDLPLPGLFTKGQLHPNLDKPGMNVLSKTGELAWILPERMINGFGFFLDVSKTEMWKVQSMAVRKQFGLVDDAGKQIPGGDQRGADEAMNDMAASLNAIHGTLEPSTVGIPQKQRNFESAFLMYAALYRRSAVALLKNMTSGVPEAIGKTVTGHPVEGFRAFQARKWRRGPALQAASGMAMAGAAIAWAAMATGNNDSVLDPGSADFMSAKFGNMRIGMGTPYYTYIRLGRDAFKQIVEEDDPEGLAELNFSDNTLLRFARSMTSPTTGIGIDLLTGTSFIGDPLRDTTGGWEATKIGNRITRNLMPFWADTLFIDDEVGHRRGALAEFFGLRVSPQSPFGRMRIARNAAILMDNDPKLSAWKKSQESAGLSADGDSIPKLLLRELVTRHPDLQALEDEISEDVQWRGTHLRKQQDLYIQEVRINREGGLHPLTGKEVIGLHTQLEGISKAFEEGKISADQFRKLGSEAEKAHMGANKQLAETYSEVIATFEERRTGTLNNPADVFLFDLEYDRYRSEVTGADGLYDDYGNFDIDQFLKYESDFNISLSQRYSEKLASHIQKYIKDLRKEGKYRPGKFGEFDVVQEKLLTQYWKLHNTLWGPTSAKAIMVGVWRGLASQQEKDYFEKKNFKIKFTLQQLKRAQDKLRKNNPAIDKALVEFYGYKALTTEGKAVERNRAGLASQRYPSLSSAVYIPENPIKEVTEGDVWPTQRDWTTQPVEA